MIEWQCFLTDFEQNCKTKLENAIFDPIEYCWLVLYLYLKVWFSRELFLAVLDKTNCGSNVRMPFRMQYRLQQQQWMAFQANSWHELTWRENNLITCVSALCCANCGGVLKPIWKFAQVSIRGGGDDDFKSSKKISSRGWKNKNLIYLAIKRNTSSQIKMLC